MKIFAINLQHLRAEKEITQEKLSEALIVSRSAYSKYELGLREPPFEVLKRISNFYHVTIDILIKSDLTKSSYKDILGMKDNRLLLPIVLEGQDDGYIEIVPDKAKAGYQAGYADPEYIENLERMKLPFMPSGKFRAFPISGDSMLPLYDGSMVVGKYLEDHQSIKNGKTYIIVSLNDGIVYKRVFKSEDGLTLVSDNKSYSSFHIDYFEILELWEFELSINSEENQNANLTMETLMSKLDSIEVKIDKFKITN